MFRNLKKTIFTTILNIIGLSVAFAAFIIILIQVNYDLSYNAHFKDAKRIYRLEGAFNIADQTNYSANLSRPLIREFGACSPDIEAFGDFNRQGSIAYRRGDIENAPYIVQETCIMSKGILDVFGFEIVAGDTATFNTRRNILISESSAKAIFGSESPLGKTLKVDNDELTIVAVYKDFPENCSVPNGIAYNFCDHGANDYSEWSYSMIVKLTSSDKKEAVIDMMMSKFLEIYSDSKELTSAYETDGVTKMLRLTSINETHFLKDVAYDWIEKASHSTTYALLTIAILIILIAIINFINFSMAGIPLIIKSINTRKVLGETDFSLRIGQIGQAVVLSVISLAVGVLWVYILAGTSFSGFISESIAPKDNIAMLLLTAAVAIFTGIAAGIYPAVYSTKFSPALVIKGSFSLSPKGRHLRTALVALQYIISLVLIIVALFINVQSSFMKKYDMGYTTDNVLTVFVSDKIGNSADAFESRLKENPIISDVTFAQNMIISNGKMGWGRSFKGKYINFDCFPVAPDFLDFFGMEIVEGRGFVPEDNSKANGTMIINETMAATFPELTVGEKISGHSEDPADVVGIVKNFNFQPLQYKINPIALYVYGSQPWWPIKFTYIKPAPNAEIKDCIKYIAAVIHEMDPNMRDEDISIRFMDDRVGQLYQKEDNLGKLILIFCALSVLISIIGILGLIYFETQFKKKEIGVRRVFGSSVMQILRMLNVAYLKISSVCFVIAIPIAVLIIKMWLKTFTYQARIPIWIFLVAYAAIIIITLLVITLQSLRAASANPVESIKNE